MIYLFNFLVILILFSNIEAREIGETEITTEDGIEVYQNEKYYLLKKNVYIESDNFTLNAETVKINFDKNLYDIVSLDAKGNVVFNSIEFNIKGNGENLNFQVKSEEINIDGYASELITNDVRMYSDGSIKLNNINGNFSLKGTNSKLINETILIEGQNIDGLFNNKDNVKSIKKLNVIDKKISYVKNTDTEMYAKEINFDSENSILELIDEVIIIRNGQKISGDYGTLDTENNSYKIRSKDSTKVKAIILNNE